MVYFLAAGLLNVLSFTKYCVTHLLNLDLLKFGGFDYYVFCFCWCLLLLLQLLYLHYWRLLYYFLNLYAFLDTVFYILHYPNHFQMVHIYVLCCIQPQDIYGKTLNSIKVGSWLIHNHYKPFSLNDFLVMCKNLFAISFSSFVLYVYLMKAIGSSDEKAVVC